MNVKKLEKLNEHYTLLQRNEGEGFQPYIIAYGYDEKTNGWCQGHYFNTIKEALKYNNEYEERTMI